MKIGKLVILLLFLTPLFMKAQSGCSDPVAPNYYCYQNQCPVVGWDNGPVFDCQLVLLMMVMFYYGCTNSAADNYDSGANTDDGSCVISGCTDDGLQNWSVNPGEPACNYDSSATQNNGTCNYPATYYDCDSNCLNDTDSDGVCDELEVLGCTDPNAFSGYNPNATDDDGSCVPVVLGCIDNSMFNYNSSANTDDGSCIPFIYGCMDNSACNYDSTANAGNGCLYPTTYYDCDSNCLNDADGDDVCDELEVLGCTDSTAFNYSSTATDDDGTCVPFTAGCMDATAFNYNESANINDGS